jgi:hypothetical protein
MRRPAFGPSRTRRVSLGLECLEDRTLPSTGPVVAVDPSAYDPGRILVQFRADDSSLLGTAPVPGTRVQSALRLVPGLYAVSLDAGVGVDAALAAYRADARVLSAEPDWRIVTSQVPNDASFGQQWSLLNTGQSGGTPGADVGATRAWDVTTGSRSTVVAVLDTATSTATSGSTRERSPPRAAPTSWTPTATA